MSKIARNFADNRGFVRLVAPRQMRDILSAAIVARDSILRGLRMRLLSYDMPRDWNYFLFGDSHIGANLRHDKGFAQMVDMINSKYKGLLKNEDHQL